MKCIHYCVLKQLQYVHIVTSWPPSVKFLFFHALFWSCKLPLILFTSSFLDEVRPPLTDSTESVKLSSRLTLTTGNTAAAGAATGARKSQSAILLGQNNNHKKTGPATTATTNAAGLLNNEPLMTSIVSLVAQLQGEISARESARPRRSQSNTSQPEVRVRVYLDVHVEPQ